MATESPKPGRPNRNEQLSEISAQSQTAVTQVADSLDALSTQSDRASSLLGLGRRIWVPADEVHVVVGHGVHITRSSDNMQVYGQSAGQTSRYWLNPRTQVIKLKTISFTVPLVGSLGQGVDALDSQNVSFKVWAHAVAQLNPEKAEIAARRIGQDTQGLLRTITQVAMSQLISAAAQMELRNIIANRQKLATSAFGNVNDALNELGYNLSVLTVTQLAGQAYDKLVQMADAKVTTTATIDINKQELAEQESNEERTQKSNRLEAETEQFKANTEAETTEKLVATARAKQKAMLEKVGLDKALAAAEAESAAALKEKETTYEASIRALEAERNAEIELARSLAEAKRLAAEQEKQIERDAALTQAEAERLRKLELEAAERAKEVALVKEKETAEAYALQAEAEAKALEIKTDSETKAAMARAQAEALSTEQLAQAAKTRAEATRAEAAAAGLAEAEVEEANILLSEKRVEVNRAQGLAEAEIAKALAVAEAEKMRQIRDVEIKAQQALADLYEQAPVLVELEQIRMTHAHEERIAQIQAEANLRAIEAIAPGVKINMIGNSGQMGDVISQIMNLAHGANLVSEEIPAVGRLLGTVETAPSQLESELTGAYQHLQPHFTTLQPYVKQMVEEMNPRIFGGLTLANLADKLTPVVAGNKDVMTALNEIQQDSSFNVIGNLPVRSILGLLGIGNTTSTLQAKAEVVTSTT